MEELQLIARARAGDSDAFARLVEVYQNRVYHQALRMVGRPEDAWDVAQEVFLKVWQGLPRFQGDSTFSTWLYRLTNNAAIDLLRREKRHRGGSSLDDGTLNLSATLSDPAPGPQQQIERREQMEAVERGLALLSEEHRQVLVLREINGLPYEQIAQVLNLSPGTVKSRLARARAALAKFLT